MQHVADLLYQGDPIVWSIAKLCGVDKNGQLFHTKLSFIVECCCTLDTPLGDFAKGWRVN